MKASGSPTAPGAFGRALRAAAAPGHEAAKVGAALARGIVFGWPNTPLGFALRRRYARLRGGVIGDGVKIHRGCDVTWHLATIGRGSSLADNLIAALGPGTLRLSIGNESFLGPEIYLRNMNHGFERTDVPIMEQPHQGTAIVIGDGVWIGARCILLAGTKIGDHCVIAAGSVVSSEIPAYSVAAGNPARVVRRRAAP